MSARIEIGSIASKEMGVARVDAAPDGHPPSVTLTISQGVDGSRRTVSPVTPALARGLAQLLLVAADRAERP